MKPIEKYQELFTALLKQAEEELGEYLTIKIGSRPDIDHYPNGMPYIKEKRYEFELHTNHYVC